jgi:hypothetical protein
MTVNGLIYTSSMMLDSGTPGMRTPAMAEAAWPGHRDAGLAHGLAAV